MLMSISTSCGAQLAAGRDRFLAGCDLGDQFEAGDAVDDARAAARNGGWSSTIMTLPPAQLFRRTPFLLGRHVSCMRSGRRDQRAILARRWWCHHHHLEICRSPDRSKHFVSGVPAAHAVDAAAGGVELEHR